MPEKPQIDADSVITGYYATHPVSCAGEREVTTTADIST